PSSPTPPRRSFSGRWTTPNGASRRGATGSFPSTSSDRRAPQHELPQPPAVGFPTEVVRVVVPGALDQDQLGRPRRGGDDPPPHGEGREPVGRAVEHQHGTADQPQVGEVVEPQPP